MRGQTDIFGLLLIFVMVAFIGIIFLGLSLRTESISKDSVFLSSKANGIVNALVKASSCQGSLEDAMVACCNNEAYCSRDSCEYLEETIDNVLSNSDNASFVLSRRDDSECLKINSCRGGVSSTGFLIKGKVESFNVRVNLCTEE